MSQSAFGRGLLHQRLLHAPHSGGCVPQLRLLLRNDRDASVLFERKSWIALPRIDGQRLCVVTDLCLGLSASSCHPPTAFGFRSLPELRVKCGKVAIPRLIFLRRSCFKQVYACAPLHTLWLRLEPIEANVLPVLPGCCCPACTRDSITILIFRASLQGFWEVHPLEPSNFSKKTGTGLPCCRVAGKANESLHCGYNSAAIRRAASVDGSKKATAATAMPVPS